MTSKNEQPEPSRYFSLFPLLALARDVAGGQYDVSCEAGEDGPSVACYTNPVTAVIDATQYARAREPGYAPRLAGSLERALFYRADCRCLMTDVRIGWPVLNRRIILRTDRTLSSVSRHIRVPVLHGEAPDSFELDEAGLQWLDDIHERAGLFAWRETARAVASWPPDRVAQAANRALRSIEVTVCDPALCDEVALFDPETGQWHFVPSRDFVKAKYLKV
ncbi:hypothetical protein HDG34_003261 [Paraburkholderia sp. HC6.4b]|uniref:hypothetical protein n=1 Tax=unclassified Paraburkholderia TaxID=2615204 RepID=UPI0016130A48|nr:MULTISPECIES: hypothetical protein [unclassified Paraburkholderia]MBB5409320.1 hypothetical protein [Paraburkholderia sp. HC6.4b]MBB5451048.1 hypothetical protein [Paraburkholderia sp. Kb1A]